MRSIETNQNQNQTSLFRVPPFPAFPNASRYVPVGTLQDAVTRVVRSVEAHEGISLVIGPPGTGKSLLIQLLSQHFATSRQVVQVGDAALATPESFQRAVLHSLGVKLADVPACDLHLALVDFVRSQCSKVDGLLIMVDEAQSLDENVLEAIRIATNVMKDGQPMVSAVLCGGPRLDETLALPSLEALVQRVATRCYLHPLNHDETKQLINDSIRNCGANPEETISDEAISSVHHASVGIPRLVNQLMTQAIDTAESMKQTLISAHVVDCAWATLQQLPSPMIDEPEFATRSEPVEFGLLDESDDEPESNIQSDATTTSDLIFDDSVECEIELETVADEVASEEVAEEASAEVDFVDIQPCVNSCSSQCDADAGLASHSSIVAGAVLSRSPLSETYDQPAEVAMDSGSLVPDDLFGDFDNEEDVIVGKVTSQASIHAQNDDNVEESLQREVIAMAEEVQSANESSDRPELDVITNDEFVDYDESIELKLAPESDVASPGAISIEDIDIDSIQWLNEEELAEPIRDDSDLLIIEDDVEVESGIGHPLGVASQSREPQSEVVSVDFQAMLAKMRGGV